MNKIGIYKITSASGRVYIGQSIDIEYRFNDYKRLRCKGQKRLYNSFLKYGIDAHTFEIIEECSIEILNERERFWQEHYNVLENGLNCKYTKTNDKSGVHSEETRKKISKSNIGKKHSEDSRKKMSENNTKPKGELSPYYGKKRPKEVTEKMRQTKIERYKNGELTPWNKGIKRTDINGGNHPMAKQVINLENGFVFDCVMDAFNSQRQVKTKSYFTSMLNGSDKNNTNFQYI